MGQKLPEVLGNVLAVMLLDKNQVRIAVAQARVRSADGPACQQDDASGKGTCPGHAFGDAGFPEERFQYRGPRESSQRFQLGVSGKLPKASRTK